MAFFSAVALHSPQAHLVVKGELDTFAARSLRFRLEQAIDRGCITIIIDASAVTFVDAGGLGMLVGLRNSVAPYGGSVTVEAASDRFLWVAELAGLGSAFDLDLLPDGPGDIGMPERRGARAS
jgi:anti-sigma B factor antagonist